MVAHNFSTAIPLVRQVVISEFGGGKIVLMKSLFAGLQ